MKWDDLRRKRFTDEEIRNLDREAIGELKRDIEQALSEPGRADDERAELRRVLDNLSR